MQCDLESTLIGWKKYYGDLCLAESYALRLWSQKRSLLDVE